MQAYKGTITFVIAKAAIRQMYQPGSIRSNTCSADS